MVGVSKILIGLSVLAVVTSCSTLPEVVQPAPQRPACANVDWYETGRMDGHSGTRLEKITDYRKKCEGSSVDEELYMNGREAGLVEFCTPSGAIEAGKLGTEYRGVCPEHTEAAFLSNYKIGQRIRELEEENSDLQGRIDNLMKLITPNSSSPSIRSQIDQLKNRRAQIEDQIDKLER